MIKTVKHIFFSLPLSLFSESSVNNYWASRVFIYFYFETFVFRSASKKLHCYVHIERLLIARFLYFSSRMRVYNMVRFLLQN